LQADGVPLAKTRCSHFAAVQFQAARRLLSQNAQLYEPKCHCCGAYLKPLCQEAERLLIVEIKIMFSKFLDGLGLPAPAKPHRRG
jgi:hypothetical protein